uniref:dynein intermediate chain 4, axonemal-like n=1 Tax=Styela clava TaxID=7725 RepID=UPI0019395775|nr:dynein intermediate chain 4, axonemal-like [Styela clava]
MSHMGRNPNKSVLTSRMTGNRTSGILTNTSQNRFTSRRSDITASQSRKSVSVSESKLGDSRIGGHVGRIVRDEDGNDVTPKRLFIQDPSNVPKHQSQLFGSDQSTVGTPTDFMSAASIYQTGTTSAYAQPFSRSIFDATSNRSAKSKTMSSIDSNGEITEGGPEITTGLADVQIMRQEVKEILKEEDLNKIVDITLEESDTIWLFEQKQTALSTEGEDFADIDKRNQAYEELVKSRAGNDRYVATGMQTFNDAFKHKDIQTERIGLVETGVTVTNWDMYDTYQKEEASKPPATSTGRATATSGDISRPMSTMSVTGSKLKSEEESMSTSQITGSRASMITASVAGEPENESRTRSKSVVSNYDPNSDPAVEAILNSDELKQHLVVMERVVTENIYQPRQAMYRGLNVIRDPDKVEPEKDNAIVGSPDLLMTMGPTLDRLWAYSCSITKGRNVSGMAWNKMNKDILAVGYGQFGFNEQNKTKNGLACCWNLKNPEYPERVFHTKAGVTAIDFSSANPNLLAVGLYDGTVCIYNVRSTKDSPVLDSFECIGKHSSPVWQLCWIDRDRGTGDEKSEVLISICADGRIVQWSIRKGFECTDLMKLKRTVAKNQQKKKEKAEAFISRQAPGLCFDFHAKDTNIYLAGTEEGAIHKCSCSYNEQYLDTYVGHTGPMYKIRWSPFSPDVFLSSSADWSIRLWMQSELKPVLNLFSSTKAVHDICWSPYNPTVFCSVNEGSVEIWDLSINTLDPIIVSLASPGIKLSCATFSKNSNSILVGDSDGQVSIYQLRDMGGTSTKQSNALMSLIESTLSSQLQRNDDKN